MLIKYAKVPLQVKSINEDGTFEGYASIFGNKDLQGDVVVKGAFTRTIAHKNGKWPILWQHDQKQPIGVNVSAEEDERGLKVKGKLSIGMTQGSNAYQWLKTAYDNELPAGLSIGYQIIEKSIDNGVTYLKELKLLEYSIVTFAANEEATVTGVKDIVTFQDLLLDDEKTIWNPTKAREDLIKWAGGENNLDWNKYKSAFLIYNVDEKENKGAYFLQIAAVKNNALVAVPAAIIAAAKSLDLVDASASDKDTAKAHLKRYFSKMKKAAPFKADESFTEGSSLFRKAVDFQTALQNRVTREKLSDMRWQIEGAKYDALCSLEEDESMSIQDKLAMVGDTYDKYGKAMTLWYSKYLNQLEAEEGDEQPDADDKAAAKPKLSREHRKTITSVMALHDQADAMHKSANAVYAKGASMLSRMMADQYEESSQENPVPEKPTSVPGHSEVKDALSSLLRKVKN